LLKVGAQAIPEEIQGDALIAFRDITMSYKSRGDDPVIDGFNLSLRAGEFFCLLGPSGCGKTTILAMLAGFERPTAGAIEVAGRPVRDAGPDRGVVFQGNDALFDWLTALQNVEFGARMRGIGRVERRRRAQYYLELVGLGGQGHKYPSELSGGMKQRIQIARVLINEPRILLMDEPFGALDAQTRTLMQEQLRAIWERTQISVLFITHDIEEAIMLGTRVGVMKAGPRSALKGVVDVDLQGVRSRTDPVFMAYYKQAHDMIRSEVLAANRGQCRITGVRE
jgi:NitT/TauT family transport system ATP-binding protein